MKDSQQLRQALSEAFAANADLYRNRGFQRRIGYGVRPALLIIDLANAWTRDGNPFTCEGMDEIMLGTQRLLRVISGEAIAGRLYNNRLRRG